MFDVKFNASEPMSADFDDGQELTADFSDTIAVTDLDYNHLENHPSIEGHELVGDSTLEDIGVVIPEVPTKVSELENDAHYATTSQIPTVPTAISAFTNDVGYVTESAIPEVPTKTSELTNDSGFITSSDIPPIPTKTSDLTNDSDFTTSAAVTTALADKVDKVSGKGLSTNDYTTAEQTKLAGIETGAEVNDDFYGVCSTAAGTVAKTVTVADNFELTAGVLIHIYFENTNTATNPTLNVNGTGAYPIYIYGETRASSVSSWSWYDGEIIPMVFQGDKWKVAQHYYTGATATVGGLMSASHVAKLNSLDPNSTTPIKLTNEDLNDIHPANVTWYYAGGGNSCAHKPTAITVDAFGMVVFRVATGYYLQILFHNTSNRQWRRYYSGSAWGAWGEITYSWNAAQTYAGLMSAADKKKLDQLSASTINVTDTKGLCGTVGATVTIQALMDAIANRV